MGTGRSESADRDGGARAGAGANDADREWRITFARVSPTGRQEERMADGLRTLASWLIRRHRRESQRDSAKGKSAEIAA